MTARLYVGRLGTGAHAPSHDHVDDRAHVDARGLAGFYRGLATNLVRVVPGTCVTFVVYENIAWLFKREARRADG